MIGITHAGSRYSSNIVNVTPSAMPCAPTNLSAYGADGFVVLTCTHHRAQVKVYQYYMTAVSKGEESRPSNIVTVEPLSNAKYMFVLYGSAGVCYVNLPWIIYGYNISFSVPEYHIYRKGIIVAAVIGAQYYNDTNVSIDANLTYYVVAYANGKQIADNNNITEHVVFTMPAPELDATYTEKYVYLT